MALSLDELDLVESMGRMGSRQRDIAETVGISQSRVSQLLEGKGVRGPDERGSNRPLALPSPRNLKIRADYDDGVKMKKLAEKYHVTPQRISQILRRVK